MDRRTPDLWELRSGGRESRAASFSAPVGSQQARLARALRARRTLSGWVSFQFFEYDCGCTAIELVSLRCQRRLDLIGLCISAIVFTQARFPRTPPREHPKRQFAD